MVFADCDFDDAVATTLRSSFSNQGQVCLTGSRILVDRNIFDRFRDALIDRTRKLRVGDPLDAGNGSGFARIEAALRKGSFIYRDC